jgi:hypothetical protein
VSEKTPSPAERWDWEVFEKELSSRLKEVLKERHPRGKEWEQSGELDKIDQWSIKEVIRLLSILRQDG